MADRYPLIYNSSANQIQELQSGDNLDIGNASIVGISTIVGVLTATSFSGDGAALTNLTVSTPTLDAVTTQGSTTTNDISVGGISATTATFTGSISVGGTITYEDVTNVDSVGLVTARTGLKVLAGGAEIVGATTATSFVKSGGTASEFLKADGSVDSSTYITAIGIQSGGVSIGNATTLNFIGTGNTFAVNGSTIDVSIQGSAGGGGGTSLDITSCLFI